LKTRAGWRETAAIEMTGPNGRPLIPGAMFGLSFADGGPGLPLAQKPEITFEGETNEQ
jgi:hypothetical protein